MLIFTAKNKKASQPHSIELCKHQQTLYRVSLLNGSIHLKTFSYALILKYFYYKTQAKLLSIFQSFFKISKTFKVCVFKEELGRQKTVLKVDKLTKNGF